MAVLVVALVVVKVTGSGGGQSLTVTTVPIRNQGHLGRAPSPGPAGPEGVPIPNGPVLAPPNPGTVGQPIGGIQCQTNEQVLFHGHTHLTIFVDGTPRQVPYGIGIPNAHGQKTSTGVFADSGTCFYWLHTHSADGIIHVESPIQATYTLGNFFDEWGQALSPNQVGPATGAVTAFYNGVVYEGNPRNIPLGAHVQVQLDVDKPVVAPESVEFLNGL